MSKLEQLIQQYCPNGVEYRALGEVCCTLRKGTLTTKELVESDGHNYPVINSGRDLYGYYPQFNNEGDAFVVASRGEYAGYLSYIICAGAAGSVGYTKKDCWAADDCQYVKCGGGVCNKYIYHYLMANQHCLLSQVRKASIPRLSPDVIRNMIIPVPSLQEQQRIVDILDRFDTLTNDLTSGLPAEIAARKQQYEYYRDKLLSFKRKDA